MTIEFSTYDFGPKFDEAVTRAEHGEEVILRRNGKEVARIVPASAQAGEPCSPVVFGTAKGMIDLLPGWDDPMAEAELADWEGSVLFPPTDNRAR